MFEEIKKIQKNSNRIIELDKMLLNALYKNAINNDVFLSDNIKWLKEKNSSDVDDFISCLLQISEYYSNINPVLSAALWGNWNAISYLHKQRTFLSIIFETEKKRRKKFMHFSGLVATAIVHFADGSATTSVTSTALNNLKNYEEKVLTAIKIIEQ